MKIALIGSAENNKENNKRNKQEKNKENSKKNINNFNYKIIKAISIVFIILFSFGFFYACSNEKNAQSYMRIHIRANSNNIEDQNIKFLVKDEIVEFLTPIVSGVESVEDLKQKLENMVEEIEKVAEKVLSENNFSYGASVSINNELFPTRYYNGVLLPSDYYDAIVVKLGGSVGDNWWCVVYPPLCFVGGESSGANAIIYKSKLQEIINKYF